ncbi:uncharacterized protein LOC133311047 [Gastrolobium bilobum]|uniref:uncharacterized protein LOC133311047 n=1 Tax=Gastrolobium bilobum TaxID=150636 RepID=UPI002AB08577|nr:uncharacterized protein LOC133311047 [Gastrolobium bilobum]
MANQEQLPAFITNPSHPFFLHPNENPSQVLVSPVLNGRNYHSWSRSMTMALRSKNKLGFINNSVIIPDDDDPEYQAWKRCNTIVLGWIHRSISQTIAQSILWIENASDACSDLRDRFSQTNMFRIDELDNPRPLPSPVIPCECGVIAQMRTFHDQDHTIIFLRGLSEQYAQVRSQIMLMEPMPNVVKAFSLVTQQERQFRSEDHHNLPVIVQAMAVHSDQGNFRRGNFDNGRGGRNIRGRGRSFYGGRGSTKLCTHCNRTNHTIETCYLLHGFPSGYRRNMINSASVNQESNTNDRMTTPSINIIQDQYQQILNLLQTATPANPESQST